VRSAEEKTHAVFPKEKTNPPSPLLASDTAAYCLFLASGKGKGKKGRAVSQENARKWEEQFSALCKYKRLHGDCNVPARADGEWKSLGVWVRSQRKAYSKFLVQGEQDDYVNSSNDLKSRFERLKSIGFKFIVGTGNGKGKRERKSTSQVQGFR
jgi:hypothetical protein